MQPHGELALLVLRTGPLERALHAPHYYLGTEHAPRAVTGRALRGHRLPQRGAHPLSRHLDQSQLGYRERLGARPVATQVGAQLLQHLVAIAARFHVDEVHDDDAADVAQPQLARHLPRRLDVGLQDRALGVLLARVAAGVHVDRGERLGRLDDQVAAGGELDARLEERPNLRLDVVLVEQRRFGLVQLHPRDQVGIDLLQVLDDFVVQHLGVDEQRVDLVGKQIADDAPGERCLALQQRRGAHRRRLALDLLPQPVQVIDLALAALLGQVLGDGADDPTARVLRDELRDEVAQLGTLITILDLARDADLGRERHVDQEAAGERNLRGDARSLGPDRLFDDLNELRFAALQLVADVGKATTGGAAATTPTPPAVAALPS